MRQGRRVSRGGHFIGKRLKIRREQRRMQSRVGVRFQPVVVRRWLALMDREPLLRVESGFCMAKFKLLNDPSLARRLPFQNSDKNEKVGIQLRFASARPMVKA